MFSLPARLARGKGGTARHMDPMVQEIKSVVTAVCLQIIYPASVVESQVFIATGSPSLRHSSARKCGQAWKRGSALRSMQSVTLHIMMVKSLRKGWWEIGLSNFRTIDRRSWHHAVLSSFVSR